MNNIKLNLTRLYGFRKLLAVLLAVVIAVSVPVAVFPQVSAADNALEETPAKYEYSSDYETALTTSGWSNKTYGGKSYSTSTEQAHSSSSSLKVDLISGDATFLFKPLSSNISVSAGDKVIISYYYYADPANNGLQLQAFTASSAFAKRTSEYVSAVSTTAKTWNYKEIEFTAKATNGGDCLMLALYNWQNYTTTVYIDDLRVTVVPYGNSYVKLNDANSESGYEILAGQTGGSVSLPTSREDGSICNGWTDVNGDPYTATTVTLDGSVASLTGKWFKPEYTQDFETETDVSGWADSEYAVTTEKAHTGESSLKMTLSSSKQTNIYMPVSERIKVNSGDTCIIGFYYYIDGSTNGLRFDTYLTNNSWYPRTRLGGSNASGAGDWKFISMEATVTADGLYLGLATWKWGNTAVTCYVDDINITVVPNGNSYVKLDNFDGNGNYDVIQGPLNNVVTLPTPQKEGYNFYGWKDAEGNAYTNTTVTLDGTVKKLTAYWYKEKYIQDFETDTDVSGWADSEYAVTTDKAHTGESSLRMSLSASQQTNIYMPVSEKVQVNNGDTCIVSFYYYVEGSTNGLRFDTYLTNCWGTRNYLTNSPATTTGQWTFVSMKANITDDGLYLGLATWKWKDYASLCYIDDINITVIPDGNSYLWLEYNYDGSDYEVIQGKAGDAITLSQPQKEDCVFVGWADKSTDAIFTGTTIPTEPVHLYAKYSRSDFSVNFEDGKIKSWGGFAINSDTANVKGGSYSLKAEKSTTGSTFALLKHDIEDIKLENGKTYVVNMNYKLVDPDNNASFLQLSLTRVGAGITGTRVPLGGGTLIINGTTPEEEWLKYSYTFTADTTENAASNYLALQYYVGTTSADNTAQVYVDDIIIHKLDDDESYATFTYKDGKGQRSTLYGTKGTALAAPEVTREDYVIRNWCTDSDLTKVYEAWLFGEENITLYANWMLDNTSRSWIFDFENNHFINGWGGFSFNTDANNSLSKSNSVKFSNYKPTQTAFAYLAKDGKKVLLEEGCTYVATVKYKVVDVDGGDKMQFGQFGIYTSNASLQNRKNQSGVKVITGSTERDKWFEHTFVFTVDTDVVDSTNLVLCFYNGKNGGYSDVYFDDITVKEYGYDTKAVVLNYNDNTGRKQIITEKSGSKFTLPAIKRDGYKLLGWFTDSALTQKYETTVFPDKVVNLYAGWTVEQTGNTWHLDFEDTDMFLNSNYAESGYSADNEIYHDGKQSLKCDYPGISNYRATLSLDGKPFIVEPGAQYVISYWSYVPSSRQFYTLAEINFWTSSINNKTSNSVRQTKSGGSQDGAIQVLRWNSPVDTWVKHTTVFTVSEDIGYNNALNICVKGNPGTTVVYFDDMTITKIEDGNSYILYHSNDDEQTDYLIQGKPGKKVNIYEAKLKTDCAFFGWYKDTVYTEQATDKELSVIPKESFSVFGQQIKVRYIQDFEDYVANLGVMERDYELYTPDTLGYTSKNVHGGKNSVHRIGDMNQSKIFLPFIKQTDGLSFEKEYVLIFWMKVEEFDENNTYLEIARENSWCYTRSVDSSSSYQKIFNLSDCEMGEWRQYTFTFTNINSFIGFKTPANSEIYFDDVAIYLKGYEEMDNLIEHDNVVELETIKDTVISISPDSKDPDNNTDTQANETVGMIWIRLNLNGE